jgi:hypothetical protein
MGTWNVFTHLCDNIANSIKLALAYHLVFNCGRRCFLLQLHPNAVFGQAFNSNDEE